MRENYSIGIDAGGTKVAYGLFDSHGTLLDRIQHPTDAKADGPSFSDRLLEGIDTIAQKNNVAVDALDGIGIAMPSFILYEEGHILMTSAMPGIKDFAMREYMQQRLPVRIVLDNDSNAAALAEYRHGAGRGSKHMVYMAVGTGLGSGIIINGKLFQGSYGWAGECGHMLATPEDGVVCGCENSGCYMSYASGRYMHEHLKIRLEGGAKSILAGGPLNGEYVLAAYHKGDALAIEIVEQMAHYIAVCVFNVYQMLNINTFVFGGGLVCFGDALLGKVRREFDRYNHISLPVHFRTAELQQNFGIIGAAEFIREV